MKTLFFNGKVYIGNKKFAYGFVVEGNIIIDLIKDKTKIKQEYDNYINLQNKTVIPSLIDGHSHFLMAANNIDKIDFSKIKSIDKFIKIIKQYYLKNNQLTYLHFEGLIVNNFNQKIDKTILDKITKLIPIMIYSSDRHSVFLNSAALRLFKLNNKNPQSIYGGIIELDNNLYANGIIKENACNYVNLFLKLNENKTNTLKLMKKLELQLVKYGISTIGTCDISETNYDNTLSIYKAFNQNKIINIIHQCPLFNLNNVNIFINKLKNENLFSNNFQIKLFLDGSISSLTAAISSKYINSNSKGILNYNLNKLKQTIKQINHEKISVVTHCIGDNAIKQILTIYPKNNHDINNGIIHYQINNRNLDDFVINKKINICIQPCFLEDDLNIINKYLDYKLLKESYRYKYLYLKNNKLLSFGTDSPICEYNPWKNIYYAISNKQIKGNKKWDITQTLNIYQALDCYTQNAAQFLKIKDCGEIKKGFKANFIVLNQDIFNLKNLKDILKTKVEKYYLNGKKIILCE